MTEAVVEIFETVDVEHQQSEWPAKPFDSTNFSFELTLKPAAISQASQVVRKRRFLANVEVCFELEQGPGPGHQQIEIRGIRDVTKRADFTGPAQILGPPSAGS